MKRKLMALMKSNVGVVLIFCLLQVSACGERESADSGAVERIMYRISSEVEAILGKSESLIDDGSWKDCEKVNVAEKAEESVVDSTGNTMKMDEEETERIFDAYEIEEKIYILEEDHIDIEIYYPQLHGFKDRKKEKKVNQLIESEAKKLIPDNMYSQEDWPEDERYTICVYLRYEIKFMNSDILSIFFTGADGCIIPGNGLDVTAMSTTIDLENVEVVALTDIITDMEKLSTLLLEDQFENISIWDGMPSDKRISSEYPGSQNREALLEALYGTHEYKVIEWYTDGDNLVIVTTNYYYEEYSADIDFYPGLVDENCRKKLQKK